MPDAGRYCLIRSGGAPAESDFAEPAIDEWKVRWPDGDVTYKTVGGSRSFWGDDWEARALAIALRTWGLRIRRLKFRRVYDASKDADIVMRFDDAASNRIFSESPTVLAYAYYPNNAPIGGDITFNDSKLWSRDGRRITAQEHWKVTGKKPVDDSRTYPTYNFMHTLIHEAGHALGLKHNEACRECVMYPYYNAHVNLAKSDISRIQNFYGARRATWVQEYFRKRMLRRFGGPEPKSWR